MKSMRYALVLTAAALGVCVTAVCAQSPQYSLSSMWKADPTRGARWVQEDDPSAPSQGQVIVQRGAGKYPVLLNETRIKDGWVQVQCKPISGKTDQACGLVWRAKDANNYYVVRINALEDNVVAYKVVNGVRTALDIAGRTGGYGVKASVPGNVWHTLRVDFSDQFYLVTYDGKRLFELEDKTFPEIGHVGIWTKEDSVTAFDSFAFGAT